MAGTNVKIAMVGGGSYTWCPRLLSDLMQTPELEGSRVVLLDPDAKAAGEVRSAAERMASTLGRRIELRVTGDEGEAFRGADFAIITISTGGLDAMACDVEIPEKYGIYHTVGDTSGPAGWSRALRNVPVFVHLAEQIEHWAPGAVVLNYTNPLAVLTGALAQTSRLRSVGLCHGVFSNYEALEKLFGVEERDLSVSFGGVNHFFWITDFAVKSQPGYPLLRDKLRDRTLDQALHAGQGEATSYHAEHALADELYRAYGYLPYVGDRHTCEFLPGLITPTEEALERFNLVRTSIAERREGREAARQATRELARGKREPYARSRETAVDIIRAISQGQPFFDVVNLPNVGQIDNLPRGAVVETLGLIDGLGFRPVALGALPPVIAQLLEPHCHVQQMTLEAALRGDRELALHALMLDPLCAHLSPSQARAMGKELISATQRWLPQFA